MKESLSPQPLHELSSAANAPSGKTVQRKKGSYIIDNRAATAARLQAAAPSPAPGNGLPAQLQAGIEQLSGIPMNDVTVHYGSSQPAQLQAHAFAQGTDIHLAPQQEKHLPHEAWHVVQQKQGRVKPTLQLKGGTAINDETHLEKEADTMGAKALSAAPSMAQAPLAAPATPASPVLQGYFTYNGHRLRDLTAEIVSLFQGSTGFLATIQDYQQKKNDLQTDHNFSPWFYNEIEKRGWQDTDMTPRGELHLSVSAFIGNYATGVYNAPLPSPSMGIHHYLSQWEDDNEMQDIEDDREPSPLEIGEKLQQDAPSIQMPKEMIGDLGERLLLQWVQTLGLKPIQQQNKSGHGLDLLFMITRRQIKTLPPQVQEVLFSSIQSKVPQRAYGKRQVKSTAPTPSDDERFVVVFEVKVNSAQLSKAQRDSDKYLYKQSKTGFGLIIQKAIEQGYSELFYEVRVDLEPEKPQDSVFSFIRRDDPSGKGMPQGESSISHHSDQPHSYLSSKILGDAGERFAREQLRIRGYTSVGSLQKDGGQGVDIVAIGPDGHIAFFEVKTHLGSGKKPNLTKREKKQAKFVAEIMLNIIYERDGYEEVPYEIKQKAWEVYNLALYHDQEAREERNEQPVGLSGVNTDNIMVEYLHQFANYYVMNVDFPDLSLSSKPSLTVMQWPKPKDDK